MKNLEMDKKVFALRKRVMALIYEAKTIANLPRIEVRIVSDNGTVLGCASLKNLHISIAECAFNKGDNYLRNIVFHEILHTVYKIGHNESCPLMCSVLKKTISKEMCHKIFEKYSTYMESKK